MNRENSSQVPAPLNLNLDYDGRKVRVVGTPDAPEWVAADVCAVLGIANPSDAIKRFNDSERGIGLVYTPSGVQEMLTVTEPGLYRLIFRSNKPEAERFQHWVFHDVLPSIRRFGAYDPDAGIVVARTDMTPYVEQVNKCMEMLSVNVVGISHEVGEVKQEVKAIGQRMESVERFVESRRREPSVKNKKILRETARIKYHGHCPCCRNVRVVNEDGEIVHGVGNYEHSNGPSDNRLDSLWLVCRDCNQKLRQVTYRKETRSAFDDFQRVMQDVIDLMGCPLYRQAMRG